LVGFAMAALIAWKLTVIVHADYSAPNVYLQFKNHTSFGMDVAAKYDFAGNRASLNLNASDIFNSRN
jgi:hypothetical protein